jgi:hypothetical protein
MLSKDDRKKRNAEHCAKTRAKRLEKGLCIRGCGQPALVNRQACQECSEAENQRHSKCRQVRKANKLCTGCNSPVEGTLRCQQCYEKDRLRMKRYRYSLTDADVMKLDAAQRGELPCDWCGKPFVETPHIDHDNSCCAGETDGVPSDIRSCGECVRGLVHLMCNLEIAKLEWVEKEFNASIPKLSDYKRRFPVPRAVSPLKTASVPAPTDAVYATVDLTVLP